MSEKLQKVMARAGLGSRRELESIIAAGRVRVDGKVAPLGTRVEDDVVISLDGKVVLGPQSIKPKCRVLMYHKPEGEVTTIRDPEDRPTVFDHLPRPDHGRWIYIGRLDLNTSGLLLFTTDGELANGLMHPRGGVERVYASRIYGDVTDEQIAKLQRGVRLEDGMAKFDEIVFAGGEARNQWYHVTLREGRNREVRRLWEAVGVKVSRLIRIRYAGIDLAPKLKVGSWRELSGSEINKLRQLAGLKELTADEIPQPLPDPTLGRRSARAKAKPKAFSPYGSVSGRGRTTPRRDRNERTDSVRTDRRGGRSSYLSRGRSAGRKFNKFER